MVVAEVVEVVVVIIIMIIIIMMMMMIIINKMMMMIIIIIALKGAANCLKHVRASGPGSIGCKSRETHRALITCTTSCCEPRGTKGHFSYQV